MPQTPTLSTAFDLILYGQSIQNTGLASAVALHSQRSNFSLSSPNCPAPTNGLREATKSITLHYTAGWKGSGTTLGWNSTSYVGTPFVVDLDGTIYQFTAIDAWTRHNRNDGPFKSSTWKFSDDTSIGIEIAKFGPGKKKGSNDNEITANGTQIDFKKLNTTNFPNTTHDGKYTYTGTSINVNLDKIAGGTLYKRPSGKTNSFFKVKVHKFDDKRNPDKSSFDLDVLYPEEQMRSVVYLVKALCEHYSIPKAYLTDPNSGLESPWIDVNDLVDTTASASKQTENKEKALSFQGIMGHSSTHNQRMDPGPSMDYYRLKRGVSDQWWYPVSLNNEARVLSNLVTGNELDTYTQLLDHGGIPELENYYKLNENSNGGFFPVGASRIWHGGIDLPLANNQEAYSVANGIVVAARVVQKNASLNYSHCFILLKHFVHYKNLSTNNNRIDYQSGSTGEFYSLYMHINPFSITKTGNDFQFNHDTLPTWLNHYIIDSPSDNALETGDIIYPNAPVTLGDKIATAGTYIVDDKNGTPVYGPSLHLEVFSKDIAPTQLATPHPWEDTDNQIEDSDGNAHIGKIDTINNFLKDANKDGIDNIDIKNAAPSFRKVATKHLSEWTLQAPEELADKVVSDGEFSTIDELFGSNKKATWDNHYAPLMFYNELSSELKASVFGSSRQVWHYHPFTFLEWMNNRVEKHEQSLILQDKPRAANNRQSNIEIENFYIDQFTSAVGENTSTKAQYNEQDYDIPLKDLAAPSSINNGSTTEETRFHWHLLAFLDHLKRDSQFTILETYIQQNDQSSCGRPELAEQHKSGDAVDIAPTSSTLIEFHKLYNAINNAITYIKNSTETALQLAISYNASTSASQQDIAAAMESLNHVLRHAKNAQDTLLSTAISQLADLRFTIGLPIAAKANNLKMALSNTTLLDTNDSTLSNAVTLPPLSKARVKADLSGIDTNTIIHFDFVGRHANTPNSDLPHGQLDSKLMGVQKLWTGPTDDGKGDITADFKVPALPDHLQGKLKYISCHARVEKGARNFSGKISQQQIVDVGKQRIELPFFEGLYWSTSESGKRSVNTEYKDGEVIYLITRYGNLPANTTAELSITNDNETLHSETITLLASASLHALPWTTPSQGFFDFLKSETVKATLRIELNEYNWNITLTSKPLVID